MPPPCEVPQFAPVRVRGGRCRLSRSRLVRHRGRALAVGLVVTAALVAAGPREPAETDGGPPRERAGAPPRKVTAPVRIADAATVRLLRPGDRVDVIAARETATGGGDARVVARGALVTEVPKPLDGPGEGASAESAAGGALVLLSVPRATAAVLVGAGTTASLAVTLC
ncbi:hypothetical protein ACIQNG_15930 [Streptomyces sp. NPDC091377]|uniref:hypothetical protein n=1 Tax=Streptomyces sp. NPDC091377 TaxID=3365995 RepID=UPI0038113E83